MWRLLMEIVLLLGTAFMLGTIAQRLKQSAIIGYLVAGAIVGPILFNAQTVEQVAELGVALLLFSIGLEFSFSRLRQLGTIALVGGTLQVIVTLVVFAPAFIAELSVCLWLLVKGVNVEHRDTSISLNTTQAEGVGA